MKNNTQQSKPMNNSKKFTNNKGLFQPTQEILKAIDNIDPSVGSTITYVFQTPRIRYNTEFPEGQEYMHESKLVASICTQALVTIGSTGKKLRRNNVELARLFEDTRIDMKATSFVVN